VLDLLGVTRRGRLVVIELKAFEDIQLPIQAVDYWLRLRGHQREGDFQRYGYFAGIEFGYQAPADMAGRSGAALPFGDGHPAEVSVAGNSSNAHRAKREMAPRPGGGFNRAAGKKGKRTGLNRPRLPGCVLGVTELDVSARQRLPELRESIKKIFAPLLVAMADQAH
jgi:hypothetical protein